MINCFAYGSNMDREDLDEWCNERGIPLIKRHGESPAKLRHYKLAFNYFSMTRNGGAANTMESADHSVYGLLIEVKEDDLNAIRDKEGCPDYYQETHVDVETFDGRMIRDVTTYKVVKHLEKLEHQPPSREYLQLVIGSAKKYGFPFDHIEYLKSIETKD
jgi:hypothetical protein